MAKGVTTMSEELRRIKSRAGQKGGKLLHERLGAEYYAEIGRKGGNRTLATYGIEHYRAIGKLGHSASKARKGKRPE